MSSAALHNVCLRVTRVCNARCDFCLAPPDGLHVPFADVERQLAWLAGRGVRKVNLCGGEPTVRSDLAAIVATAHAAGLQTTMTTNALRVPRDLPPVLQATGTSAKVSLHGAPDVHDAMLGVPCGERVQRNILAYRDAGVRVSVQTVVTHRHPRAYLDSARFCLDHGLPKLSLIPFIPRGRGRDSADDHLLTAGERAQLDADVARLRREEGARLDVRVLDFWARDYYVVETDGKLMIERETEEADTHVANA